MGEGQVVVVLVRRAPCFILTLSELKQLLEQHRLCRSTGEEPRGHDSQLRRSKTELLWQCSSQLAGLTESIEDPLTPYAPNTPEAGDVLTPTPCQAAAKSSALELGAQQSHDRGQSRPGPQLLEVDHDVP